VRETSKVAQGLQLKRAVDHYYCTCMYRYYAAEQLYGCTAVPVHVKMYTSTALPGTGYRVYSYMYRSTAVRSTAVAMYE
jgi:hypothetical protein